jgi:general secretion pathway protein A
MYIEFYGLKEKPFEITPDPKFLFLSENHKEALAYLTYAVRERKGFTVITGEVGTGKTTLIQTLLSRLDGSTKTAYIFNPKLGSTDFLHYICEDFGLKGRKRSKGQYIAQLHDFLLTSYAQKENAVVIIDEAQKLNPELLEEVRLLTNLETPKSKLLQVVMMGQPELNETLNLPEYRQLKQRVSLRYHMRPFSLEETEKYIRKRLRVAGAADVNLFTPKALKKIFTYSNGIPRLINIVCDNALLLGYSVDQRIIGGTSVREVIADLEGGTAQKGKRRGWPLLLLGIALLMTLVSVFIFWVEASLETSWILAAFEKIEAAAEKIIDIFRGV